MLFIWSSITLILFIKDNNNNAVFNRRMSHRKLSVDGLGWDWIGWYPGGVKYRAPYGANNTSQTDVAQ